MSETPAVAALMGATAVSILRLPLSSVVIVDLLVRAAGAATAPIIIVAVVVAYITVESLSRRSAGCAQPIHAPAGRRLTRGGAVTAVPPSVCRRRNAVG